MQLPDPGEEYVPIGQMEQADEFVAPVALDAVPAGQSMQFPAPVFDFHDPMGQLMQVEMLMALVVLDDVPAGHSSQPL